MFDAAKAVGMTTIGLQHGTIHEMHFSYRFTQEEMEAHRPVPDHMLTWGEHWVRSLREHGNYPASTLHLTGQPRADIIPVLKGLEKTDVLPWLDETKPLISFATQMFRTDELRKKGAEAVLEFAQQHPEIQVVFKLHPREKDLSFYQSLIDQYGCKNVRQEPAVDLYSLLAISDALITISSTVGAEAIYFHLPLVVLDLWEEDSMGYIESGIGLAARNGEELGQVISDVLAGNRSLNQEQYDRYIRDFGYKIDGKAGERIVQFIKGTD